MTCLGQLRADTLHRRSWRRIDGDASGFLAIFVEQAHAATRFGPAARSVPLHEERLRPQQAGNDGLMRPSGSAWWASIVAILQGRMIEGAGTPAVRSLISKSPAQRRFSALVS